VGNFSAEKSFRGRLFLRERHKKLCEFISPTPLGSKQGQEMLLLGSFFVQEMDGEKVAIKKAQEKAARRRAVPSQSSYSSD
jgi:hypothetical protein